MPELPEVETSCNGIRPLLLNQTVDHVIIRQAQLRWLIPEQIIEDLPDQRLKAVTRRAKYILLTFDKGTLIIHLGMSGSLRILDPKSPPDKHDHFELVFGDICLRLRDPRRFGAVLWTTDDPFQHKLLKSLGVEPLTADFDADYLYQQAKKRKVPIKTLIMDSKMVVGIGNIYACEALFSAGISPTRPCCRISKKRLIELTKVIKVILTAAIKQGGTTLKDFQQQDGKPGYFAQSLKVYGREGQLCVVCGSLIKNKKLTQRSTFYCPTCQH